VASTVTSVIELLVGLACLGLAAAVRSRMTVVAVVLAAAGLTAFVHAVIELV
jgi:hypothetical protein